MRLLLPVLALGLAFATGPAPATQAANPTAPLPPIFVDTPCTLPGISPGIATRLRCGTVAVPRNHENPTRGQYTLAVVIIHAPSPAPPDPVLYISGGPGSPLTIYTEYQARHPYDPTRNLILVDQRGMGRSEPSICPAASPGLLPSTLAVAIARTPGTEAARHAAFTACHDEATARGIDLEDFGTLTTVEDFETIRRALGIERWNVIGESYGTTVAMTLMARHPTTIRTAVLDSIYPPDDVLPPFSARVAPARDAFFAMCQADPACAAAYPDLAGQYRQAMDRLASSPLTVPVPAWIGRPGNDAPLTASLFEVVVANLLYYPVNYPSLPRIIHTVRTGYTHDFGVALAAVLTGARSLNIPAHVSVECRDRHHYRDQALPGLDALATTSGACSNWAPLGPPPLIPANTPIPTLILAGQFDPNAPLALSRHIADLIGPHARWIEFPLIGHNVNHFSPCGLNLIAALIRHPNGTPDSSCTAQPPIQFLPPPPG